MSYTITEKATQDSVTAETRTEAVRLMEDRGVNVYAAVRLLDAADGLALPFDDLVVTVARAYTATGSLLKATPSEPDPSTFTQAERDAHARIYAETGSPIAARMAGKIVDFYLDGSPVYAD